MLFPWGLNRVLCSLAALIVVGLPATAELSEQQRQFFEERIRPVLVEHCYPCHNSINQADSGLALDHRAGLLRGGDGGQIIVPGKPSESRLLAILRHEISGLEMPEGGGRLSDSVIADFDHWISTGAADPRETPSTAEQLAQATSWEAVFARRSAWWSLQPVQRTEPPAERASEWSQHPVDQFVLSRMAAAGLQPASRADRQTLLRRATFVLTGLPPTVEELQAFLADSSPGAFETVLDRLLNSPQFGERWARHWMDLMRYSESHGSQGDPELPNAHRYRDYLIRAFNQDVPYRQLVLEHLAGDLLPEPRWNTDEGWNESAIGPAHLRMVELGFVPVDALEDQMKVVDNQIDVYSRAFLGLTVSCARCHHHKFDAISQDDFHALYGIFASSRPGQLLIDAPERLETNRHELQQLQQSLRSEVTTAWQAAAMEVADRLREQTHRAARQKELAARAQQLRDNIAAIEVPAQAIVLQQRGRNGSGTLPTPDARWSFTEDARDSVGQHHGELFGGAEIRNGRLVLNGVTANVRTSMLDRDIHEKTFEAWVALVHPDQRGGGVIGLETPDGRFFDSIVFGELTPRHWLPGSDFFNRTQEPGGEAETSGPDQLIHVAIVYAADNSVTMYRNGQPLGTSYRKGTLQPFLKGRSRFLFGQRLSDINPPLAGEIDEARAYLRPLTAAELALSFQAGPTGVTAAEIAAVLDPSQQQTLAVLRREHQQVQQELSDLQTDRQDPWTTAFNEARTNTSSPLHFWLQATTGGTQTDAALLQSLWRQQAEFWQREQQTRRATNETKFRPLWDVRGEPAADWFCSGTGLVSPDAAASRSAAQAVIPAHHGQLVIEPEGDRVLQGLHPSALLTHGLSQRHTGVLQSPRFQIDSDNIFVRAMGQNSQVRVVIENYPLGNGGLYPAVRLNRDELGWLRLDTAYRRGSHAYVEFVTDPTERAYFGAAQLVAGDQAELPVETSLPAMTILEGDPPTSIDALAQRYSQALQDAVRAWQTRTLTEDQLALLDYFVRRDLFPTTLSALPQLRELVERYRQLEREIPVPRRAPGVLEAAGFDQPLLERGQLNRPGRIVPRGGLQVLGAEPFATEQSGRLQLAEQTALAANPLTARVMVNRLWQHVFGHGIVRTPDNFGRLGELPTHPELLDYLAARFVEEEGWSIKRMLRLLMTSATWQQATTTTDAAMARDGNNLWLSHMPIRRLEAEAIRDAILAVSGQLDLQMYGPGVNVYFVGKTEGGGSPGPLDGDRRRSVYQRVRRNAFNPFLEAFDAPRPSTTRGRRDVTNAPVQALTMLNDPFVIDQAKKWAASLVTEGEKPEQRIRRMFLRALGREPDQAELQASLLYLADLCEEHRVAVSELSRSAEVWQDFAQSMFCLKEFLYVH